MESFSSPAPVCALPLEIREEIYKHLLLPQHVYTSYPRPARHNLPGPIKAPPTYVDTRIYLPVRLPTDILQTCSQLRDECMAFHARLMSSFSSTMLKARPLEDKTKMSRVMPDNSRDDEGMERLEDGDVARITLEIVRPFYETMGPYIPERVDPSPRFLTLLPLLGRLKKMKFTVWAGFDWWSGISVQPIARRRKSKKAQFKRTSADQDDKVQQPSQWEESDANSAQAPRPDPLIIAINTLLEHLPLVQEIDIHVLLPLYHFLNWDVTTDQWGRRACLDSAACSTIWRNVKRVNRRHSIVQPGPLEDSTFVILETGVTILRQRETKLEGKNTVLCERGARDTNIDWTDSNILKELDFTEREEYPIPSA